MAFIQFSCPICNSPVLATSELDLNSVEILANHLYIYHKIKATGGEIIATE